MALSDRDLAAPQRSLRFSLGHPLLRLLWLKPHNSTASAPPDFLDHRAIVQLALAMLHAGLQDIGMNCEQRKLLPHPLRLFEHQVDVLEMLGDATFGCEFA